MVTPGGYLQCQNIIHINGPERSHMVSHEMFETRLQNALIVCFEQLRELPNARSLSLPILTAIKVPGNEMKALVQSCADIMLRNCVSYSAISNTGNLQKIRICISPSQPEQVQIF